MFGSRVKPVNESMKFVFWTSLLLLSSEWFSLVHTQPWVQQPQRPLLPPATTTTTRDQQQRPFNPFQQTGNNVETSPPGVGVGDVNIFANRTRTSPVVPVPQPPSVPRRPVSSDFNVNINRFRQNFQGSYFYYRQDTNFSLVKYLIIAPEIVQPESIFRVIVSTFANNTDEIDKIEVKLSVFKDGVDIRGNSMLMNVGDTEALILQIPMQITNGSYKFRLEGNYPNTQGGSIFVRESNLTFSAKFLSILIQTNRYIFTGGQKVKFRVILLRRDLKPYGDPVDIYIRDSRGFVMRRYPSVPTKMGVIELTYELPEYTNLGNWTIQVQAGPQIEEKTIIIEKYFPALYEVTVTMSPFLLAKDETITATIASFYGTEKSVHGPARVSLLLRAIDREDWTMIQEDEFFIKGSQDMEWPMFAISSLMETAKTYVVRVEATVTDFFVEEPRHGFAESCIISQSLQLKFISPSPLVFRPGLPFETYIQVSYSDFEKIPPEILRESHLRITPEVFAEGLGTGTPIGAAPALPGTTTGTGPIRQAQLPVIEVLPESSQSRSRDDYWYNEVPGGRRFDPERRNPPYYYYEDEFFSFPQYFEKSKLESYWKTGLFLIKIPKIPKEAMRIRIRADYTDAEGNFLAAETIATRFFSPERKYIHIKSNNLGLSVGEYAVIQFKANFFVEKFHYVILGKGLVLQWAEERLANPWSVSKTFAVPISTEMAPGFRVIVFSITRTGEVLTDTVFLPVDQITKHSINMELNQHKDRSKDSVEVRFFGEPGAFFGISSQRSMRHFMQSGNELSKASVLRSFYELEPSSKRVAHTFWRSRSGEFAEQVQYFQTFNGALDANRTFYNSHILVFVDGQSEIPLHPLIEECQSVDNCTGDCYSYIDHCGKVKLCQNRRFEYEECELSDLELIDFRAHRVNHIIDFYDPDVGDWAWTQQNLPHGGDYYLVLDVPGVTDTFYVTGFAIGVKNGFAIMEEAIEYESNRPFLMTVDAPPAIRRGEQVGIITNLFNKTPKDIFVTIILHGSDDYEFVHAGDYGLNIFDAGQVRFSKGEYHHFVWIPLESEIEVRIPVRPTIDQGTIEVGITATAQVRSQTENIEIQVLAEGVQIGKHTSMVLDLKNRAFVLKYLNIFPEVTPEVPYDEVRKYIIGSKAAHVMLYGDIMGPIFPEIPINIGTLLGKPGKGSADRVFDLAVNVWSLHYLRLTNQLDKSTEKQVFVEMNKIFAQIMKRFREAGYFKMWNLSRPSVWLSAWAIRVFAYGSFQDWENYFYVEETIFALVTKWILNYQNYDGTFSETMWYGYSLNKRMGDGRNLENNLFGPFNVSLTAHVAITLHQVVPILDGGLRVEASIGKNRAIQYLERVFVDLNDPYQIALVTYALTLVDSVEKDAAFSLLHTKRIETGGLMYWSGGEVPTNAIIYENQRPFTEPKNNEYWDSYAVEATSYALMVYLMRDGVTPMSEQIVLWLNTMKLTDGSFISSIDTAVAFQALTEYANRARLRDVTDLTVTIEFPSTSSVHEVKINSDNIKEVHTFDIDDVWGHVNVIARGSGQAVVQLDLSFGIERDEFKDLPPQDCFELQIREFYSAHRNKTALTIESCFRWIYLEESPVSGAAVLEVEIPSGYGIVHSDALSLIEAGIHPTLKDVVVAPGKTSWYFDHIPAELTCFNYTVRRWHPVANLTMYKQATLYEAYTIERFVNTLYSDWSARDLTICQVCGSFQCPYCPFYNRSHHLHSSLLSREILILLFSTLSVFIHVLHNNHHCYYYDVSLSK